MRDFLENFPTEEIEILDNLGNQVTKVKGLFRKEGLTITNVSIPIVEGEYVLRKLPNEINEKYIIINSKYNKGHGKICDFYKLKLQKEGLKEGLLVKEKYEKNVITNNFYNCEKVNIDSIDNTINVKLNNNEKEILKKIEQIIDNIQNNKENRKLFEEMCNSIGKKSFVEKYQSFISSMADHITILSPFIPFLTSLINK